MDAMAGPTETGLLGVSVEGIAGGGGAWNVCAFADAGVTDTAIQASIMVMAADETRRVCLLPV